MNHDKANQVEVGEGPKAADAALQRIVRSREAAEAEAPFDIENVSKLLGDLDLGADVGSTEVIDDLGELDFAGEDVLGEQIRAELAEIIKLGETDSKAADAALQRMARAREAREAEALKAETPEAEAPSDIESVEALRGDLDLGADVGSTEAIEHVRELDAVAEAAVEGAIAKAEAYEAQDVLDEPRKAQPEYLEQLRAARIKYSGGVEVAADDPLATDKIRVSRYLKQFGLTLDALPSRFWDEPDETVRGGLLGDVVGPVMATRRFEKRVERSIEAGYPADYYSRPRHERGRIGHAVRKRRSRAE